MLGGLSDKQLAQSLSFRGWSMPARLAVQSQIGHLRWHATSIEEALKPLA